MKVNAIMLVENEADIVEESLLNAMKFCHKIYVCDGCSNDGTWELINEMAHRFNQLVIVGQSKIGKQKTRSRIINRYHSEYSQDDWWYMLNADELLSESPASVLKEASSLGKNAVNVWQAEFFFTREDLATFDSENVEKSITQRRRHYLVNNKETRFFKNDPEKKWPESRKNQITEWDIHVASNAIFSRRFSLRTPEQINKQRLNSQGRAEPLCAALFPSAQSLDEYDNNVPFKIRFFQRVKMRFYQSKYRIFEFFKGLTNGLFSTVKRTSIESKSL